MRAPGGVDLVAVARVAGAVRAKLRVVVAPRIQLPAVGTGLAGQPGKRGVDAACVDRIGLRAVDLLLQGFQPGHHRARAGLDVVLPGPLVLRGFKQPRQVKRAGCHQRLAAVHPLAEVEAGGPGGGDLAVEPGAQHVAAQGAGSVGAQAVVEVLGTFGIQQAGVQRPVGCQGPVHRGVQGFLVKTVAVGVVVAKRHRRVGGREPAIARHRAAQRIAHGIGACLHTGRHRPVTMAAQRHLGRGAQARGAAHGKDLHHAADRIGTVQGGCGALEHLDTLDLVQRQVVPDRRARRGRAITHAVDQQQGVARLGAADEDVAGIATAPVGAQLHRHQPCQHLGQGASGRTFDIFAVNNNDLAGQRIGAGGHAGSGDHHLFELGLRHRRQCSGQGQGEHGQARGGEHSFHGIRLTAIGLPRRPRQGLSVKVARRWNQQTHHHLVGRYPGWRKAHTVFPGC